MQELEKILEELNRRINEYVDHDYVRGSGDVVKGLSIAKSIIRKHMNDGWIPCEERLPGTQKVLITDGEIVMRGYRRPDGTWKYGVDENELFSKLSSIDVIAWQPLPEPYRPERSDDK